VNLKKQAPTFSKKKSRKSDTTQVKDVARLAGASTATVSRALNTPDLVSPQMLDKVLRAAQALNWVPNGAAKALASKRSNTIGILIPTLAHQKFSTLIESMQRVLGKAQYTLILGCDDYSPELRVEQARKMVEQGIECLVLVGEAHPAALMNLLRSQTIPHVITYTSGRDPVNTCVGFNNYEASMRITNHLLDLGHKKFAMLAHMDSENDRIQQRVEAVKDALAGVGLGIRPEMLVRVMGRQVASARAGFRKLMEQRDFHPTAIVCTNDYIAMGAVFEAHAMGICIPSEISIVGFDDIDTSAHLSPALTTIRVPAEIMGEEVARYIIKSVRGDPPQPSITLTAELIVRASTAPPRQSARRKNQARAVSRLIPE
jgi:LacI family transcriptional regulator